MKYVCADPNCGHDYNDHNSVIVPWGCSVVDSTSIDCVNGFQGPKPPQVHRHHFVCAFCGVEYNGPLVYDLVPL